MQKTDKSKNLTNLSKAKEGVEILVTEYQLQYYDNQNAEFNNIQEYVVKQLSNKNEIDNYNLELFDTYLLLKQEDETMAIGKINSSGAVIWTDDQVYVHKGSIEFNGENKNITGMDRKYIDTGIKLFDEENYSKDFEIGFEIEQYIPSNNDKQATFVTSKW